MELPSEQLDGWNGARVFVQPVVEAVVPESTDVTEGWGDADMAESMMEMSEDAADLLLGRPSRRRWSLPNTMNSESECVWQLTKEMATKSKLPASAINVHDCAGKPHPESTMLKLGVVIDALSELPEEEVGDWVPVRRSQALTFLRLWRLEELLEDWQSMGVIRWDDTRLWVAFCPSVADALNDEDCLWQRGQGCAFRLKTNLASHVFPCDCRQAQDAWHHGRYGQEGQLTSASLLKKPVDDSSRICTPMSCWQAARPCSKVFFCSFQCSRQVLSGPPALPPV